MHTHPRSVRDTVFDAWSSPGRFTKNPDLIQLSSGRLLFVYSDTDAHWAQESEILTLVASDDGGETWYKFKEVARAEQPRDERLGDPKVEPVEGRRVWWCSAIMTISRIFMRTRRVATGPGHPSRWETASLYSEREPLGRDSLVRHILR